MKRIFIVGIFTVIGWAAGFLCIQRPDCGNEIYLIGFLAGFASTQLISDIIDYFKKRN